MQVLAVQMAPAWLDRPASYAAARRRIDAASPAPGSLIVLPEMFPTGFACVPEAAEAHDGPTHDFLAEVSQAYGATLVGGAARRGTDGLARNEAIVVGPEVHAVYAKRRPFRPGGERFHAGDAPVCFAHAGATLCPLICYDLRFPELFRDAARLWRPEVFLVIASWPSPRIHHWVRLLQARAIENQAFVVGVNRAGSDPHHSYSGRSVIVDPDGEILADAGDAEGTIGATLDIDALREMRRARPFLEDMR